MKRETGTARYFWALVVMAFAHAVLGKSIEGAIFFSAAGIVGTMNLIARAYFDEA